MKAQSVPYTAIYTGLRPARVSLSVRLSTPRPSAAPNFLSELLLFLCPQEAASVSVEAGLGGGRSLLQARGGSREKERERQRRIKEGSDVDAPVEFKVNDRATDSPID